MNRVYDIQLKNGKAYLIVPVSLASEDAARLNDLLSTALKTQGNALRERIGKIRDDFNQKHGKGSDRTP